MNRVKPEAIEEVIDNYSTVVLKHIRWFVRITRIVQINTDSGMIFCFNENLLFVADCNLRN